MSLDESSSVVAFRAALSDRNGDREEIRVRSSWSTYDPVEVRAVSFWRLDDWLEQQVGRVNLIEGDVDGEASGVPRGGLNTIRTGFPLFLLMIGALHFEHLEVNPVALLRGLGYRFWDLTALTEYPDERSIQS